MTTGTTTGRAPASESAGAVTDEWLITMLVDRARGHGLQLTGDGGLLPQRTERVLESVLDGEITGHVGYDKHDSAGKGSGNTRTGGRTKTVFTDVGPVPDPDRRAPVCQGELRPAEHHAGPRLVSCRVRTRSRVSTPVSARPSAPVVTSRPSRPHRSACTWR